MKTLIRDILESVKAIFAKPAPTIPKSEARQYKPRQKITLKCENCGSDFESTTKRSKFCSNSCRTLAYNARKTQ